MPLENDKLPDRPQFPVLEEGTYQVVIVDKNEKEGTNFNTGEPEKQYQFDLRVVDPEENAGHMLKVWSSTKYSPAKPGRKEAKLYTIVTKAMKKIVPPEDLHLNELIDKQLKVVVSVEQNEQGYERNKIVSFLEAKQNIGEDNELALPEDKVDKSKSKLPENKTDEIDLNEIPF